MIGLLPLLTVCPKYGIALFLQLLHWNDLQVLQLNCFWLLLNWTALTVLHWTELYCIDCYWTELLPTVVELLLLLDRSIKLDCYVCLGSDDYRGM